MDTEIRLLRLNAVATLMDLLGYSVSRASQVRDRLTVEQMRKLMVAGAFPIKDTARKMALNAINETNHGGELPGST